MAKNKAAKKKAAKKKTTNLPRRPGATNPPRPLGKKASTNLPRRQGATNPPRPRKTIATGAVVSAAARIGPSDPPPAGTGYVFNISKGDVDPRTQQAATIDDAFIMRFVGFNRAEGQVFVMMDQQVDDDADPTRMAIGLGTWNNVFAPLAAQQPKAGPAATATRTEDPPAAPASHASAPPKAELVMVRIADIDAGHNIRTDLGEESMGLLQASIEDLGMLEPVVLRKDGKIFRLVAGYRRLEAAKRSGADHLKAMLYEHADDRWEAEARLAENVQRLNLNHMDLARALGQAKDAGLTVAEIASHSHLSDDTVRRHLTLRRLTKPVADLVASGRLPVHHGALIARVGDASTQIELVGEVTRLDWGGEGEGWAAVPCGGGGKYNPDADVTDHDYVMPMATLRERVGQVMQGMAACGWPMGEEYAGKRACQGCPDNTATYADQPMLFAGCSPRGSDKKGFCTNGECYAAKAADWEKVKDQRRKEKKKKTATAIRKAKAAGVAVCEECGIVRDVEKVGGRDLCAKHATKAKGRSAGGGGESYEAQEKRRKAMQRRFPETAEQRLAVAIHQHGANLAEAIRVGIADGRIGADGNCRDVGEMILWAEVRSYSAGGNVKAVAIGDLLGGGIPAKQLAAMWRKHALWAWERDKPGVNWIGNVCGVPLPKDACARIQDIETLAMACGIEVPERPTAESIARDAVRETIVKGKRPDAEAAIEACRDSGLINKILADAEAGTLRCRLAQWKETLLRERWRKLKSWTAEADMVLVGKLPQVQLPTHDCAADPSSTSGQAAAEPEGLTPEQIETASREVLVAECKRRGLSARGKVTALRTRLNGE